MDPIFVILSEAKDPIFVILSEAKDPIFVILSEAKDPIFVILSEAKDPYAAEEESVFPRRKGIVRFAQDNELRLPRRSRYRWR